MNIIHPSTEILVAAPTMRFEAWFDVKLIDARTKHVKRHLRFRNLIVDAGLDNIGVTTAIAARANAGVGTGSTAPTAADTALQTPIGTRVGTGGAVSASGPAFAYWSSTQTFTFLEPNANGNLTEIGLFQSAAGGAMWSRQLFKDVGGVPTVITKTAAEQLQITYELRLYSPTVDSTGSITISGVTYAYTVRACDIGSSAWSSPLTSFFAASDATAIAYETDVLGSTAGHPAGTPSGSNTSIVSSYAAGTFYRDHTYVWDPGSGNFPSGIGSMTYGAPGNANTAPFQISWTPKIAKTVTKRLTLVGRIAWGRYP